MEPASIRYKNPGAMWGGNPISKKWGEMGNVKLNDGMGQNNHIAVFPDFAHGIAAQIDLWRTPRYHNKTFRAAITVWSGGNWVDSYVKFVTARVPGMTSETIMSDAFLNSPTGILFLKAQAAHEAGKTYPALEADWVKGQQMAFGTRAVPVANDPKPKTTTAVVAAGAATTAVVVKQAASSGMSGWAIAGLVIAGLIGVGVAAWWFFFRHEKINNGGGRILVASPEPAPATLPNKGA